MSTVELVVQGFVAVVTRSQPRHFNATAARPLQRPSTSPFNTQHTLQTPQFAARWSRCSQSVEPPPLPPTSSHQQRQCTLCTPSSRPAMGAAAGPSSPTPAAAATATCAAGSASAATAAATAPPPPPSLCWLVWSPTPVLTGGIKGVAGVVRQGVGGVAGVRVLLVAAGALQALG